MYNDKCFECQEIKDIIRIETHPKTNEVRKYCNDCFNKYNEQCEVCGDSFVNIGWHNLENRLGRALLV